MKKTVICTTCPSGCEMILRSQETDVKEERHTVKTNALTPRECLLLP